MIQYFRFLQIIFPGVTEYTFHKLLCYLYTDEIPQISTEKCLNLLELANRLCLPRLLNLVECRVIEDLTKISQTETNEAVQHCLQLLEPVKVRHFPYFIEFRLKKFSFPFACTVAQCSSVGRMVYVVFVCELQHHLQDLTEKLESPASRKSGIFARASLATGLVFERF